VLGADGALGAGPPELAEPARALLAAAPEADDIEVSTADASVFAACSDAHRWCSCAAASPCRRSCA
jgi:hypothetical protein